jgi:protein-disulfide isomerase
MSNFLRHLPGLGALLLSAAALAFSLGLVQAPQQAAPMPAAGFSDAQVTEIGRIAHDHILKNPEVIRDAIEALQAKEAAAKANLQAQALSQYKEQVFADADAPVAGNAEGDVTLVEFFDYKCPYCKQVSPALDGLLKDDPKLKIVFKEFPILGDSSLLAARAALAAKMQDKYVAFHHALMAHRGALDMNAIAGVAMAVGLDVGKLMEDMKSEAIQKQLAANHQLAEALGIRSTPTFIVGDQVLPGALSIDELKTLIAEVRKGS